MFKKLQELRNRYPKMFSQKFIDFSILEGWHGIVDALCRDIQQYLDETEACPQVTVQQVKEKFGGLRFYICGGDDHVYTLIKKAESQSFKTCESCGAEGKPDVDNAWVTTLCDDCRKKDNELKEMRWNEINEQLKSG